MTVGPAVVVVVVVEASASKVYPMVTLASASTLSVSMVRTLRGEEGLLKGLGWLFFGSMQGLQGYFCAPYFYQFDFGVRRYESLALAEAFI